MSHEERLAAALEGGEKLHPGLFKQNVEKGVSVAWQNMPGQAGGWAYYQNQAENPDFLTINKPQGRLLLAGDYFGFLSGVDGRCGPFSGTRCAEHCPDGRKLIQATVVSAACLFFAGDSRYLG